MRRTSCYQAHFVTAVAALCVAMAPPTTVAANPNAGEIRVARYLESVRHDPNLVLAFLREMPKGGDLHNDLCGASDAETLVDWATERNAGVEAETRYLGLQPGGMEEATVPV